MRVLASLLLSILLIPLSILLSLSLLLEIVLFNPSTFTNGLEKSGVYEVPFTIDLTPYILQRIQESNSELQLDPQLVSQVVGDIQTQLRQDLGPGYVQQKIEPLVHGFFAWFNGNDEILRLHIEFEPDRLQATAITIREITVDALSNLPPCSMVQDQKQAGEGPTCLKDEVPREELLAILEEQGEMIEFLIANQLPSQVKITEASLDQRLVHDLRQAREMRQQFRHGLLVFASAWVILLGLLFLLQKNYRWQRWVGAVLIVGFLVPSLLSLMLSLPLETLWQNVQSNVNITADLNQTPPQLVEVGVAFGSYLVSRLRNVLWVIGLIPLLIGIALFTIPHFVNNKIMPAATGDVAKNV